MCPALANIFLFSSRGFSVNENAISPFSQILINEDLLLTSHSFDASIRVFMLW